MKVAILGSTGMLGHMVERYLREQGHSIMSGLPRHYIDAQTETPDSLVRMFVGFDYAINCIGLIKPRIDEDDLVSVRNAIQVNALFPHHLAQATEFNRCKVIQIATDCVYSGTGVPSGGHDEASPHDPLDVYGKTKSLGEVISPRVSHLRCSIVGPELAGRPKDSLLEWFLGQPKGATIKGFTNHCWNGITTLAFAKICHGIMRGGIELPCVQHVVPYNSVTKAELLSHFAYFYNRGEDISIEEVEAPVAVDRTLATALPIVNEELWRAAGYDKPPYIQQLIEEMAAYK